MPEFEILYLFQGIATLAASEPRILIGRVVLIFLGFLLIYLGKKGVLEALLMIPMGSGWRRSTPASCFSRVGGWEPCSSTH